MSVESRVIFHEYPEPLVSILIPSYNHEDYVVECLDSVKQLCYPRLELLLSDDCSRDKTYSLAEQWVRENAARFERIFVRRQEKNMGVVGNLQFLFDCARGEYLAYIASDDMFLPTAIDRRVRIFQSNGALDAIFANAQRISDTGALMKSRIVSESWARCYERLSGRSLFAAAIMLYSVGPGPAMMLRRGAVLEGGSLDRLPEEGLEVEDVYIYVRVAARARLGYVDEVVAKYRETPISLGRSGVGSNFNAVQAARAHFKNIHLLTGFSRLAAKVKIARNQCEEDETFGVAHSLKVLFLRAIVLALTYCLLARTFFLKNRIESRERILSADLVELSCASSSETAGRNIS